MSDRTYPQDLPTVRLPDKFVSHWINELIRLHDLTEVLYRSISAGGFPAALRRKILE